MDMLNFSGQTRKMMGGGGLRIVVNNGEGDDNGFGLPVVASTATGLLKPLQAD